MRPRLALTTGEPAGIGPEIAITALADPLAADVCLIGDSGLIRERARKIGQALPADVQIEHVSLGAPSLPGRLDVANAHYVLATLDLAISGCLARRFDAIVTAPIQKSVRRCRDRTRHHCAGGP